MPSKTTAALFATLLLTAPVGLAACDGEVERDEVGSGDGPTGGTGSSTAGQDDLPENSAQSPLDAGDSASETTDDPAGTVVPED